MTHTERIKRLAEKKGVLRASDLEARGIPRQYLQRLFERGQLERVARGLYMLPEANVTEHHTMVEATRRVSHGVVCLLSALRFHGLTTQAPHEVWLAIDSSSRRPQTKDIPIRIVYMSGGAFEAGVETHTVEGTRIRIFGAAKTVADCFKFRSRLGVDVAIEALRDYRRRRDFDIEAVWNSARICRVANVMRPFLEAIV